MGVGCLLELPGKGKENKFYEWPEDWKGQNGADQMGRKRGDGIEGNNDWRES